MAVKALSLLIGICASLLCLAPQQAEAQTKSAAVNRRLASCLERYACRITQSAGVCRGAGEEGPGRSAKSCHLQCKAIDIVSVKCARSGSTSNHENLALLRDCLSGVYFSACYAGKGPCDDSHQSHLHFGPRQFFACKAM